MSRKDTAECVRKHPKNAAAAWQAVIDFQRPAVGNDMGKNPFLEDWKKQDVYKGLKASGPKERGSVIRTHPEAHLPENIRTRYSIDALLRKIPDEATAEKEACVAVYDKSLTKEEQKQFNTNCGPLRHCFTLGDDGYLENAASKAKKSSSKNNDKGQVSQGYCMSLFDATKIRAENWKQYTEELQLAYKYIDILERKVRKLENPNEADDGCDEIR